MPDLRPNPAYRPASPPAAASPGQPACAQPQPGASARRWTSAALFGPAHEIEIEHGQSVYRLRLTSLGKLILTK